MSHISQFILEQLLLRVGYGKTNVSHPQVHLRTVVTLSWIWKDNYKTSPGSSPLSPICSQVSVINIAKTIKPSNVPGAAPLLGSIPPLLFWKEKIEEDYLAVGFLFS